MEGLLPSIYRAVVRQSSTYQILSRSGSRRNILSSPDQHSSSGRSFGGGNHHVKYYTTRVPATADSGQLSDTAPQEFQLKSPDRKIPSVAQSLDRRAGKLSPVNRPSEFHSPNSFHYHR